MAGEPSVETEVDTSLQAAIERAKANTAKLTCTACGTAFKANEHRFPYSCKEGCQGRHFCSLRCENLWVGAGGDPGHWPTVVFNGGVFNGI